MEEPVEEEPVLEEVIVSEFTVDVVVVNLQEYYFEGDVIRLESRISGECNEPSYQWQIMRTGSTEWVDVEGATAAYYEYTLNDSNWEDYFRVIVVDQAPTMELVPVEEAQAEEPAEEPAPEEVA